jgi:DNA-binding response OmpR family regulator
LRCFDGDPPSRGRYDLCFDIADIRGEGTMQIGVEVSRAVENKRIFVVEDDEIVRAALQFMLHDENETHEIASLDQAYRKARAWKPDLILLGLSIVRSQGTDVFGDIAAQCPGANILIVADAADDPLIQACLTAGAQDVLAKPLTIESVRFKVDVLLGRRKLPMIPLNVLG